MSDDTGKLESDLEVRIEKGLENGYYGEDDVAEVLDNLKEKYEKD